MEVKSKQALPIKKKKPNNNILYSFAVRIYTYR